MGTHQSYVKEHRITHFDTASCQPASVAIRLFPALFKTSAKLYLVHDFNSQKCCNHFSSHLSSTQTRSTSSINLEYESRQHSSTFMLASLINGEMEVANCGPSPTTLTILLLIANLAEVRGERSEEPTCSEVDIHTEHGIRPVSHVACFHLACGLCIGGTSWTRMKLVLGWMPFVQEVIFQSFH